MNDDVLIPIVLFGCLFGVVAIQIIAKTLAQVVSHWRDVSLKMRMIDAGFSPYDIEQVLNAGRSGKIPCGDDKLPPIRKPGVSKQAAPG